MEKRQDLKGKISWFIIFHIIKWNHIFGPLMFQEANKCLMLEFNAEDKFNERVRH